MRPRSVTPQGLGVVENAVAIADEYLPICGDRALDLPLQAVEATGLRPPRECWIVVCHD